MREDGKRHLFATFDSTGALRSRALLAVGLIVLIGSIADLLIGPSRVVGGKWAWLVMDIRSHIGFYGYVLFESMVGAVFVWCAIISKPKNMK